MPHAIDKKARNILFSTYWSGSGWIDRRALDTAATDPADFAYAKAQGLMFDPVSFSHDECLADVLATRDKLPAAHAARAFVSSLSTRRLDWRSGLASHALAQALAPHPYTPVDSGRSYGPDGQVTHVSTTCRICRDARDGIIGQDDYRDIDLNVMNFERLKWGGVRHGKLEYTWLDLRELSRLDVPEPTDEDVAILNALLRAAATSQAGDRASTLEPRLKPLLASSKNERRMLIEALACIGVLRPLAHDRPGHGKSDWQYAFSWRGEDGICTDTARHWFGPWLNG